jgi:DNA-binding transcriptional ArsR family regulator
MARDVFIRLNRCHYCNRPGFVVWDVDLFSCDREVCKSLAFAEVRRRHRDRRRAALPETRLAQALLTSLDTLDYALRRDENAGLLEAPEAARLREGERRRTARLLSELRELAHRYPPPAHVPEPAPRPPDPLHRRFVRSGRTVTLRRERQRERRAA